MVVEVIAAHVGGDIDKVFLLMMYNIAILCVRADDDADIDNDDDGDDNGDYDGSNDNDNDNDAVTSRTHHPPSLYPPS